MNRSSFQTLQFLINSLNVNEKQAIEQRALIKHNKNGPASIIKLYNLMQKNPSFDEEMIYNRWVRTHTKMQSKHAFENARTQLKFFILDTLRFIELQGNDTLQKKLDHADILIKRGLKEEAYKILSSVDKKIIDFSDPLYYTIINYKKLSILPFIESQDTEQNVKTALKECSQFIAETDLYNRLFDFNLQVGLLARNTVVVKTKLQRQRLEYLLSKVPGFLPVNSNNILYKSLLYKSLSWLFRITGNYKETYKYQLLLIETMQSEEETTLELQPKQFLSEIADMINICLHIKSHAEAENYIKSYTDICSLRGLTKEHNLFVLNNYRISLSMAKEELKQDDEILHKQLMLLKLRPWRIQKGHFTTFIFIVMKGFFATGQFKTVINCYAELLQEETHEREDILFFSELLYTLSLYLLQPLDYRYQMIESTKLFKLQAESLQRRLRIKNEDLPIELNLSNCIRQLANKSRFQHHVDILTKLINNLTQEESEGCSYHAQFYEMFDIKNWAKNRIAFLQQLPNEKGVKISTPLKKTG